MSGRKLGGGRVLGSGRGLAPPTPPITNAPRVASPLAASESSISIASSSISPPVSGISPDLPSQDIGNSISVGAQGKGPADGALVCPICNEEMVNYDDIYLECCLLNTVPIDDPSSTQPTYRRQPPRITRGGAG